MNLSASQKDILLRPSRSESILDLVENMNFENDLDNLETMGLISLTKPNPNDKFEHIREAQITSSGSRAL